jgi:hypothetical protein
MCEYVVFGYAASGAKKIVFYDAIGEAIRRSRNKCSCLIYQAVLCGRV